MRIGVGSTQWIEIANGVLTSNLLDELSKDEDKFLEEEQDYADAIQAMEWTLLNLHSAGLLHESAALDACISGLVEAFANQY